MNLPTRPAKSPRPLSLTVVGIWLIASGGISVIGLAWAFDPAARSTWAALEVSPLVYIATSLLTGMASLIAGAGVLRGQRWGRTLYLITGLAGLVMSVVVFRTALPMVLFGLVFYGVFVFLLTRKPARAYFAGTYELPPALQERRRILAGIRQQQRNASDLKRVIGVIFAIGAAFLIHMTLFIFGFIDGLPAVILAAFFGVPALIACAIGIVLWGRVRWAGVSGWILVGSGASSALFGLVVVLSQTTESWAAAMAQAEPAVELDATFLTWLILLGLLIGSIGAAFLFRQHRADLVAADFVLDDRRLVDTL